jgi:hypothetical protein
MVGFLQTTGKIFAQPDRSVPFDQQLQLADLGTLHLEYRPTWGKPETGAPVQIRLGVLKPVTGPHQGQVAA